MQWFISRLNGKEMTGAAIFSILALIPSDPAALWDGMSFSNSLMFFNVICGIVNCGLFMLSAVRSLMCSRRARHDECDGKFRSSSRGSFTKQRFRHSAMPSESVINLASSFSWRIGAWLFTSCLVKFLMIRQQCLKKTTTTTTTDFIPPFRSYSWLEEKMNKIKIKKVTFIFKNEQRPT